MKSLHNPADRDEILRRLESLQPHSQRRWGSMTPQQMINHLADSFRLYMGELPAARAPLWYPRVFLKWTALWAPFPWPHGFKTPPELDQQGKSHVPPDFSRDVEELRSLVDRFVREPHAHRPLQHPHFGPLSNRELMRLAYLHADHHLRQFGA